MGPLRPLGGSHLFPITVSQLSSVYKTRTTVTGLSNFFDIPLVPGLVRSHMSKSVDKTTSPAFTPSLQNWKFSPYF